MTWLQFIGANFCILFPFLQIDSVAVYPSSKREMTISDTTGKVAEKKTATGKVLSVARVDTSAGV
jgi:hypothetical protein